MAPTKDTNVLKIYRPKQMVSKANVDIMCIVLIQYKLHIFIKNAPYKALYGQEPSTIIRGAANEEVSRLTAERNIMLEELKKTLSTTQNKMKREVDGKRRDMQLELGDKVYLKIQPYKLKSLAKRVNQKLSPRFYGPFEVIEKINPIAFKLKLPEVCAVHPVFHISLVKHLAFPANRYLNAFMRNGTYTPP
ncbi:unnamed protein product, partial [Cuscuta epithymum]